MMNTIFLSGGTGNIGSRILAEMLRSTDDKIVLLLRCEEEDMPEAIRRILDFWNLPHNHLSRIEGVKGDITSKNLGISASRYKDMASAVTHVIHCAASVKLNMDIDTARGLILEGTANMVEFAKSCSNLKRFCHFSTMEVTGNLDGTVGEEFLSKRPRKFLNTYEQAKSETEDYLEQEHDEGLPLTIYRPSMVIGDSESGKQMNFQSFYHMLDELFLNPELPVIPKSKSFRIDTVPVDFIAKIVQASYDDPGSDGKIYNLTAGREGVYDIDAFRKILEPICQDKGIMLKRTFGLPARLVYLWLKLAEKISFGKAKHKIGTQLIFIRFFLLDVSFENHNTKELAQEKGIRYPMLKDYLPAILGYYLEQKQ